MSAREELDLDVDGAVGVRSPTVAGEEGKAVLGRRRTGRTVVTADAGAFDDLTGVTVQRHR